MEFTGRLTAFPAANLLQWAAHERASGTLVVRRTKREKRVALRLGRVVDCRSNQPQELFGQYLIAHGLLDAGSVVEALVRARAGKRALGEVLAEDGRPPLETLREALERAIRESVQDLFLWRRGVFYFEEGAPRSRTLEVAIDSSELVLEGTRWIDEWERLRKVLVDDAVTVEPGPIHADGGLDPYARRIARLVASETSLGRLYEHTGGVQYPFLQAVSRLIESGVLAIARVDRTADADSRELDLREVLLGVDGDDVLLGRERAILPIETFESLVPAWIRPPASGELAALTPGQRAFLEGFDGRTTLRRLFATEPETRADQIELLLLELKRRNVLLLPASVAEVERRTEEGSRLRKMVRRLRGQGERDDREARGGGRPGGRRPGRFRRGPRSSGPPPPLPRRARPQAPRPAIRARGGRGGSRAGRRARLSRRRRPGDGLRRRARRAQGTRARPHRP